MRNVTVKVKVLEGGRAPEYKSAGASGADLYASKDALLRKGQRVRVPTGVCLEIPEGYEGQVRTRSSMADQIGVFVLNQPATIDSDYRGEVEVMLFNGTAGELSVRRGDRIAQLIIAPVARAEFERAESLSETARGAKGYGSTGRRDDPVPPSQTFSPFNVKTEPEIGGDFIIGEDELGAEVTPMAADEMPTKGSMASPEEISDAMFFCACYSVLLGDVVQESEVEILGFDPEYGFAQIRRPNRVSFLEPGYDTMKGLLSEAVLKFNSNRVSVSILAAKHGMNYVEFKKSLVHAMMHAAKDTSEHECAIVNAIRERFAHEWKEKIDSGDNEIAVEKVYLYATAAKTTSPDLPIKIEANRKVILNGEEVLIRYEQVTDFLRYVHANVAATPSTLPMKMALVNDLALMGSYRL